MDRLEAFVRATSFRAPGVQPDRVVGVLQLALASLGTAGSNFIAEGDDRAFVKAAALGLAFYQELAALVRGEFELDFREEAILEAVLDHLKRAGEDG